MKKNTEQQHISKLRVSKNFKNKKYKFSKKNFAIKLVAGALVIITLVTTPKIKDKITEYLNLQAKNTIVQEYGEKSIERNIVDYIMVSERLHNLNLGKFEISKELIEECNIEETLLSPSELTALIDKYNKQSKYIPYKSIEEEHERIILTAQLIYQEKLVNGYIYDKGYDYAHDNITKTAKNYVGEVFGVDPLSVVFDYKAPKDDRGAVVNIKIIDDNYSTTNSYYVSGWGNSDIKNDIIDAVTYMDRTDKRFDNDDSDNNSYDGTRNTRILNALKLSAELNNKLNSNNLFNENLSEELTGKSK